MPTESDAPRFARWKPRQPGALENSPVVYCFVSKLYRLLIGRTIFHERKDRTILTDRRLSFSPQPLLVEAEKRRTQGRKFRLQELPALALVGKRDALVLIELSTWYSFSHFIHFEPPGFQGNTVREVAEAILAADLSVVAMRCPSNLVKPAALPFVQWQSAPTPAGRRLRFFALGDPHQTNLEGVLMLQSTVSRFLQEGVQGRS